MVSCKKYISLLVIITIFSSSCKRKGCTDSLAINYEEKAKEDDGSCEYLHGCTDKNADNVQHKT